MTSGYFSNHRDCLMGSTSTACIQTRSIAPVCYSLFHRHVVDGSRVTTGYPAARGQSEPFLFFESPTSGHAPPAMTRSTSSTLRGTSVDQSLTPV